jgi:uncharacterized membrane protein
MSHPDVPQTMASDLPPPVALGPARRLRSGWVLAAVVVVAAGLRSFQLGRLSFWYDEVVTMRLARAGNPGALLGRLFEIDASRAPLHPLLLQAWTATLGASEAAARSFSVLCGTATVVLVYAIGRCAFDPATGRWAAWLAALSPALIVYSREARMYAWLVLVTVLAWWLLLGLRRSFTAGKGAAYAVSLTAMSYSHPLGLLMAATLALAGLIGLIACFGSLRRWLAVHLVVAVLTAPWIGNYLDHPPEFLSGPLPLRYLLGTPIGFLGGDSRVLLGLVVLIAWGIAVQVLARDADGTWRLVPWRSLSPLFLLLWLILPPSALYLYSRLAQPIFGPARYTMFVAPAYLVLLALGLARTPAMVRYPLALALTILAASELGPKVYDPELKADWREFAAALTAKSAPGAGRPSPTSTHGPGGSILVLVASSDAGRNVEVETARYYLPPGCEAIALEGATPDRLRRTGVGEVYLAVGSRRGVPVVPVPEQVGPFRFRQPRRYWGLTAWRAER